MSPSSGEVTIDQETDLSTSKSSYARRRPYFLSLSENRWLRYVVFFYLYVMQGVPAGFSGVALANYLTGETKQQRL
jgi:hypothetical protein